MDAAGRKAFWDVLCNLPGDDYAAAKALIDAAPWPEELCRFRAVNENSLLQLQNNEQFFSTADYYDDPFDSYFFVDFQTLQINIDNLRCMLAQDNVQPIRDLLTTVGLGNNADGIITALKATKVDMDWLKLSLNDVRNLVQSQINSICFCEDAMNETMWLKYAEQHKGFVQVYDFNDPSTRLCGKEPKCAACGVNRYPPLIFPVYYGNEMYNATAYALNLLVRHVFKEEILMLPQAVQGALVYNAMWQNERISLIKKECHQYDKEWRMLLPMVYTNRPRIRLKPKSIIIGLRTPEYHKRMIISAAKVAGIQEIYQAYINEKNLLDKERIAEE